MTTDPKTWNELADEITALMLENKRLRALQEKEPCEYHGDGKPLGLERTKCRKFALISIYGNKIIADLKHDYMQAEIKYCPTCGAKVDVE